MNSRKSFPNAIRLPALNRRFSLGQLYDVRSDKLIVGKPLWSLENISKACNTRSQRSSECDILTNQTHEGKLAALGIPKGLKLSIQCNLVPLFGSARYLSSTPCSRQQERVTLKYKCTTKVEQVDVGKLIEENVKCPEVFSKGTATHVVCAIVYGGQAFFVFDKFSCSRSPANNGLREAVTKLPKLTFDEYGRLEIPKDIDSEAGGIGCQLYSDFRTPYQPNRYRDAAQLFKSLSHFVEGSGTQAVPVEVWLYPLDKLNFQAARMVREVRNTLVSQIDTVIGRFDHKIMECNDLAKSAPAKQFPGIKKDIQEFQQLITSYKNNLQERMGPIVIRIRTGSAHDSVLEKILEENEASPFARHRLDVWVQNKHVQLQILGQSELPHSKGTEELSFSGFNSSSRSAPFSSLPYMSPSSSAESPPLSSLPTSSSLAASTSSDSDFYFGSEQNNGYNSKRKQFEVCFHVNTGGKMSLTKVMSSYLQHVNSGSLRSYTSTSSLLQSNSDVYETTLKKANQFKDFVEANRFNDNINFSFAEESEDNDKPDVYITVHRDGALLEDDFQPLTAPSVVHLVRSVHDKIMFKWSEPESGRKNITFYEVFYKKSNGNFGESLQVDAQGPENSFTLDKLELGTAYDIQVRAVCELGTSKMSNVSSLSTLPATPPGKPIAAHIVPKGVHIQWAKPLEIAGDMSGKGYIITVQDVTSRKEFEVPSDPRNGEEMTLHNLNPSSSYQFRVRAVFDLGETEDSEISDVLEPEPKTIMKGELLAMSTKVKKGKPSIHRLKIKQTLHKRNDRIRKCELGQAENVVMEKVIMVVGATGAGKTTLINGLVNYILGVDWKDDFRFQLIVDDDEAKQRSQAQSQTRWITSYTLHHRNGFEVPYTLTVIDTPGFGDTSGIKRDQEITQQIRTFFTTQGDEGIDHIDAIGFVTQASLPRLTPTQRFIFDSVLALFGKDISDNIFLLVTFADGQRPPVLEGVKVAEIPYRKFFKFNNSALYAANGQQDQNWKGAGNNNSADSDEDEGSFDEMFWEMGEKSFATFFKSLNNTQSKSLVLTKDVLNERHRLETHVAGIHQHIRTGLNKLEQLRIEVDVLKRHETDIEMNKDFTYTITEEAVKTVNIPSGTYITNCLQCNFTCHYPCGIPDDAQKRGCAAMDSSQGVCMVCPSRCVWNVHKNMTYRFEIQTITKTKTAEELKARYEAASGEKLTAEQLVKNVIDDFESVQLQVIFYTDLVRKSLDRLKEIALKPNPLSTVEYIDILIHSEESQRSPGWKDRLKQLEDVRKQAETLQLLAKPGFDPFEEYKKMYFDMRKKGEKEENIYQTIKKMFKSFLS